jgi:hypothetical protein
VKLELSAPNHKRSQKSVDPEKDDSRTQAFQSAVTRSEAKEQKHGLYVYCIIPYDSPLTYGEIGVKNNSLVHTVRSKDLAAIVSDFEGDSFEKTDANVLAHQRVVQKIFEKQRGIPVKFGTIHENEEDVRGVLEDGSADFKKRLSELAPKKDEAPSLESVTAPTDIIAQILSQSASSAVKIRAMTYALDELKRKQYDKSAERMPEGAAKQLLEFLANAPPGSYEVSETPKASENQQMPEIVNRLHTVVDEISRLRQAVSEQTNSETMVELRDEQQKIREALGDLRNLYSENAAAIGFQLGTVVSNFGKLETVYKENAASLERTVEQTIRDVIPPTIEEAVRESISSINFISPISPPVPEPRAQPTRRAVAPPYTWCIRCRGEIGTADRFCDRCGWPTALTQVPPIG